MLVSRCCTCGFFPRLFWLFFCPFCHPLLAGFWLWLCTPYPFLSVAFWLCPLSSGWACTPYRLLACPLASGWALAGFWLVPSWLSSLAPYRLGWSFTQPIRCQRRLTYPLGRYAIPCSIPLERSLCMTSGVGCLACTIRNHTTDTNTTAKHLFPVLEVSAFHTSSKALYENFLFLSPC